MIHTKQSDKHVFAFYYENINDISRGISDTDIIHRITTVLRLEAGESVIFFNKSTHVRCTIQEISKKKITVTILEQQANNILTPAIHWLLPVLEREAFEEALYALAAMGATSIQPIITKKSRQQWGKPADLERANRIMISAAEQSKQFVIPDIKPTILLENIQITHKQHQIKIFFDASGNPAFDIITRVIKAETKEIVCLIGPEGDLIAQEKEQVVLSGFIACALTPTILRASHAATVGMGILRSLL